jgi:hypothetical protein
MWSLGCIIAEMYGGVPLFPGLDENELLEFHTIMCGEPSKDMLSNAKKRDKFYNKNNADKLIRSKKSRLVSISQSSLTL